MLRECRERFSRHRLQRKSTVSNPYMHHGTCVTHVPWRMSGSLTLGGGENVPTIPGACATLKFTYPARDPCHIPQVFPLVLGQSVRLSLGGRYNHHEGYKQDVLMCCFWIWYTKPEQSTKTHGLCAYFMAWTVPKIASTKFVRSTCRKIFARET